MAEIDREKVIKALECCCEHIEDASCSVCPYVDDCDMGECTSELAHDALALLKEQEETKTIICPKCGDEIEIKWSLLIKPDIEAIAKRDAFMSDKNGKKLNDAMQSLLGEINYGKGALG